MKHKRLVFIISFVAILILLVGYLAGNYFVSYALQRDPNNPESIPEACAEIHDPTRTIPPIPAHENSEWQLISADGLKLDATYFPNPSHNWAILVHGYGRDKRYAYDYAEEYLRRGFNVLVPNLRASGTSEGTYLTMGVKESEDVRGWISKIVEQDPESKIVLHGVSMGAATVLLAAEYESSKNLVAVVEDCGYTSAYEMFSMQLEKIFGLPSFPIMNFVDIVSYIKTGAMISDAAPIEKIRSITVPVLFIHGDADGLVPIEMMEKMFEACLSEKRKLIFENVGHADSMQADPKKYFGTIFEFLNEVM